ncbi:MAG: ASCH domain-containing protein [Enterococcus sp.]
MEHLVEDYWQNFCNTKNLEKTTTYKSFSFSDTKEMANTLAHLVVHGRKTGTSSGAALYEIDNEPFPEAGEYSIILDGNDQPVCIIQTITIEILPFSEVTESHAKKEGEGDLSLAYWRDEHLKFFKPFYEENHLVFTEESEIVFEEFEVVYAH